jgi:hypothetical protein
VYSGNGGLVPRRALVYIVFLFLWLEHTMLSLTDNQPPLRVSTMTWDVKEVEAPREWHGIEIRA